MPNKTDSTISAGLRIQLTVNNPVPEPKPTAQFSLPTLSYPLLPILFYLILVVLQSLFAEKTAFKVTVVALKRLKTSLASIRYMTLFIAALSATVLVISTSNLANLIYVIVSLVLLFFEIGQNRRKNGR